jgi:hypothetical protein
VADTESADDFALANKRANLRLARRAALGATQGDGFSGAALPGAGGRSYRITEARLVWLAGGLDVVPVAALGRAEKGLGRGILRRPDCAGSLCHDSGGEEGDDGEETHFCCEG